MDEKWFHVIRTRKNNKVLTSIGLEPAEYYAQHKSYIGKCMYVVVTAFAPHDNDFTKGGIVIPVACVRVGKEVEAKKDSFKRVYREDGTWHHPQIPANRLRKKYDKYFKSLEITGSSEGTEKNPKCSSNLVSHDDGSDPVCDRPLPSDPDQINVGNDARVTPKLDEQMRDNIPSQSTAAERKYFPLFNSDLPQHSTGSKAKLVK